MNLRIILAFLAASLFSVSAADNSSAQNKNELLLTFPDQWQFSLPEQYIILTSDQQLLDLQDPDKKINMSLGLEKNYLINTAVPRIMAVKTASQRIVK